MGGVIDPATRTFFAEAEFANADGRLRPGLFARVDLGHAGSPLRKSGEPDAMQKLAELCVRRPVFATVLILVLVVVGFFAYHQLGVDRFPKVDFPFVVVTTTLPGAAPGGDRDRGHRQDRGGGQHDQRHRPAELHLVGGRVAGQIQFALEKDADVAAQEVRDKVNRSSPSCPRTPIRRSSRSSIRTPIPVISIALSGPALACATSPSTPTRCSSAAWRSVTGVGQVKLGRPAAAPDQRRHRHPEARPRWA